MNERVSRDERPWRTIERIQAAASFFRSRHVADTMKANSELSLIVPVFNEEDMIEVFLRTLDGVLGPADIDYEVLFVNDGSSDASIDILRQHADSDPRIRVLSLSRRFGKEQALTAGLDYAGGAAAIPIDCDLQDPPEVILDMYSRWKDDFDVVLAKRIERNSDSFFKRLTSALFYRFIRSISEIDIPENVGDFRLIDRKVIETLKKYPERNRFMKDIFASVGFRQTIVEYSRPKRAAGTTKWSYLNLYKLAVEGIVSFTSLPLKIWSYVGALTALLAFFYGLYLIVKTLIFGVDVPGYASIMVVILIMSGLILLSLGVIGEYVSRIFTEVKHRPIYVVMEKIGFQD